jgi:hypothetical protein
MSHHVVRAVIVIALVVLYGLSAPARDGSGRRDYGANDLDQLRMVVGLRGRQAEIRAARSLIRGWSGEIKGWLVAAASTP